MTPHWTWHLLTVVMVLAVPSLPQLAIPRDGDGHGGGHGGGGHGGGGHGGGGYSGGGSGYGDHGGGYGGHGGGGGGYGGHGGGGGGYGGHGGGGGGGYGGGGGHGGGGYNPSPCHPQTITKYNTVYKDRKAEIVNNVEVRNPKPHVKKVVETRYTTLRYPVFITQVIKPLLTQVETKVRPMFFTKTINRYTTVKFTVTGIGQVTITTVKFEKEYITRCMKKGYGHRRDASDGPEVRESIEPDATTRPTYSTRPAPPPGIPYDAPWSKNVRPPIYTPKEREIDPAGALAAQETLSPDRPGFVRPNRPIRPFRPSPPRPVGPPGPFGLFGALAQFGDSLTGSQRDYGSQPNLPHPPLTRPPVAVIG
ncbi:uncharacterized protein LOC121866153 [Homarus americanus]|uniref:uncharacterized protein LOC121866153 n=1 Tax=Homarus americanus TaxID=6706 RepID=UPI001C44D587|nr:uncharacterized protein LOC121866153 [Homarus americanus]